MLFKYTCTTENGPRFSLKANVYLSIPFAFPVRLHVHSNFNGVWPGAETVRVVNHLWLGVL